MSNQDDLQFQMDKLTKLTEYTNKAEEILHDAVSLSESMSDITPRLAAQVCDAYEAVKAIHDCMWLVIVDENKLVEVDR